MDARRIRQTALGVLAALLTAPALAGPPAGVAAAQDGSLMACIDDLPDGVEVQLTLEGSILTRGEGPRFRGRIVLDDGGREDSPEPSYYPTLLECLQGVVRGPDEPVREPGSHPERVLIF